MAVNTTTINGFVHQSDGSVREKSYVIFTQTGFDTDDGSDAVIVSTPIRAPIAADGSISQALWPNPDGVRSTRYNVRFELYNGTNAHLVNGGEITVPVTGGPYALIDLMEIAASNPPNPSIQDQLDDKADVAALTAHTSNTSNPHSVTAAQIGVEDGATANDTDANLLDRANHTGTQPLDTVTETAALKILTDAERIKLAGVEVGATADQTGAEIKAAYEGEADTNAFTDAEKDTLGNITATEPADLDGIQEDIEGVNAGASFGGLDYVFRIRDALGRVAFGITKAGVTAVKRIGVSKAEFGDSIIPSFAFAFTDGQGRAAGGLRTDGTLDVASLLVAGQPVTSAKATNGANLSHQLNYFNNAGQSLGEGSTEPDGAPSIGLTTTQEFNNVGFPARADSPTTLVPLTVANTQRASRGESPMYGTAGMIKRLIQEERNIVSPADDYQLVGCNNAISGTSITLMGQGSDIYNASLSQVTALMDPALNGGRDVAAQAVTWTQGEADANMAPATYIGHLTTLAEDFDADYRAITGQNNRVKFIMYQTPSNSDLDIAQAQLDASNNHPLITMAAPIYQLPYGDTKHITAEGSRILGGYYGLAYERSIIDGEDFKPLQPVQHSIIGNTIDLFMNKTGLEFDITTVPAQTDMGFSVRDGSNALVSISSIEVVGPNRVRLTMATTPAAGWSVRYGDNAGETTGLEPYVGGAGNLRDNQGLSMYHHGYPMHNWTVLFVYEI